jgi:alpha-ribazole phosphatase
MQIWLVRHTSVAVGSAVCYGRTDVELAPTFGEEARLVGEKLGSLSADTPVITSPAQRCLRLASTLGGQITEDPDLWEMHFGDWEGRRWDDLPRVELDAWAGDLGGTPPPGGETLTQVAARVQRAWQRLLHFDAETVCCVTHAGVIRVLLAGLFEMPIGKAFSLQVDHGGCTLLLTSDLGVKLKKFNL